MDILFEARNSSLFTFGFVTPDESTGDAETS